MIRCGFKGGNQDDICVGGIGLHALNMIIISYLNFRNITLLNVIPFLISRSLREWMFLVSISHLVVAFPIHISRGLDIKVIHQRIQATRSQASHCHHYSCCHYRNVDFVLFHNVTCYINSLLSCIQVHTTCLLNITCTMVAIGVICGG